MNTNVASFNAPGFGFRPRPAAARFRVVLAACVLAAVCSAPAAERTASAHPPAVTNVAGPKAVAGTNSVSATNSSELKLPGLVINREQRCVDIESSICLREGSLELVACSKTAKDAKTHESILVTDASPLHVHAALLLLGAKSGNPAMRKIVGEKEKYWIDIPPSGGPVDVFLVLEDKDKKPVERPINDFIISKEDEYGGSDTNKDNRFPTNTFIFAGSLMEKDGTKPNRYLCNESGNLISLVTFGDEVLCLPDEHSSDNGSLLWRANFAELPPVGTRVILRLRPKPQPPAKAGKPGPRPPAPVAPRPGP